MRGEGKEIRDKRELVFSGQFWCRVWFSGRGRGELTGRMEMMFITFPRIQWRNDFVLLGLGRHARIGDETYDPE